MDDYISREAAILTLLGKGQSSRRYKLGQIWELNFSEIREAIATIPAADVVEVVRCRDCKNNYNTCLNHGINEPMCDFTDRKLKETDFCSRGERRTE